MTPLAWLLGLVPPACGYPAAQDLSSPPPMDTTQISRPDSLNTALAAPAGCSPRPDIVTPTLPAPAKRLFGLLQAMAAKQPRSFQAALSPDRLQVHHVVRGALFDFPNLVMGRFAGTVRKAVIWSCIRAAFAAMATLA